MHCKPELLLPAGNPESFFAALQAGADAIYLGLEQFNARGRATNFNRLQFIPLIIEARKHHVKVYVTLNTVVKNTETGQLIDYLHFLQEAGADGIIIQDWGVYYLAAKHFPKLVIHASTQMGIHNSLGIEHLKIRGFKRTVLARELTLKELEQIVKKSPIETEVFVHGALCYSFSGMCLFSSYNGGRGANRGICAQPCRREYDVEGNKRFFFNLKDNQLIDYLPQLSAMGVSSLKVEGRLKSAEYVYRVGSAYKLALEGNSGDELAKKLLDLDFGRPKTAWFAGGDVKNAISDELSTGVFIGTIERTERNYLLIASEREIEPKNRLRIISKNFSEPINLVVSFAKKEGNFYRIEPGNSQIEIKSKVYLTKLQDQRFNDKIKNEHVPVKPVSQQFRQEIINNLKYPGKKPDQLKLWFRIDSPEWLNLINFNELDGLILSFTKATWNKFDLVSDTSIKNNHKVFVELPKFISEGSVYYYKKLAEKLTAHGISGFVISHLYQKSILPENSRIISSENVYVFNDAATRLISSEGIDQFIYPFEIDFETLESFSNKNGIVPVYFFPELFYSRMPVHMDTEGTFRGDDVKSGYKRHRKNGMTIVVPDKAVSILQHKNRLVQKGFSNFLIDVSYDTISKNRLKTLKTRFLKSEQIQPSTTFNFTKGLF